MKSITLAVLAVAVTAAGSGTAEAARKGVPASDRFDGRWSIEVVTESGVCDRAYRYGVLIENGEARYPGGDFTVSGRVAPSGAVRATIANAVGRANVVGRLARGGTGGGTWTTVGSIDCRGRWSAERRR